MGQNFAGVGWDLVCTGVQRYSGSTGHEFRHEVVFVNFTLPAERDSAWFMRATVNTSTCYEQLISVFVMNAGPSWNVPPTTRSTPERERLIQEPHSGSAGVGTTPLLEPDAPVQDANDLSQRETGSDADVQISARPLLEWGWPVVVRFLERLGKPFGRAARAARRQQMDGSLFLRALSLGHLKLSARELRWVQVELNAQTVSDYMRACLWLHVRVSIVEQTKFLWARPKLYVCSNAFFFLGPYAF